MSKRPFGIVANKFDLESAQENAVAFRAFAEGSCDGTPVYFVSAKMGLNLKRLLQFMNRRRDE